MFNHENGAILAFKAQREERRWSTVQARTTRVMGDTAPYHYSYSATRFIVTGQCSRGTPIQAPLWSRMPGTSGWAASNAKSA